MFFSELSPQAKSKVIAFLDVDPEKYGEVYINHHHINPVAIPVLGRDDISALLRQKKVLSAVITAGSHRGLCCKAAKRK